jgi:1-acyl-sn-glycerol-3-phosphate acyltransferase
MSNFQTPLPMNLVWFISWIFAFPLLKLITGIEICGTIPKTGPCIVVCNHVSFLDPPVVGITACREVYFLAKIGLFTFSKAFAWLIRKCHAIPITGTQGLRTAAKMLKRGHAVVIFPEGTRSRKGYMLPFNPGVSYLAINLGVPIIPAYIANSNKRFISLVLRINRLKIRFGKPMYPTGYKREREDFEKFAAKVREEVLKLR